MCVHVLDIFYMHVYTYMYISTEAHLFVEKYSKL